MPLTKEQLAKIAQKEATLSAALKRSTSTNYYEGYFFITLNTRDYAPILSYISGRPDAPEGAPSCHAFTCSPLPSPPSPVARASTPVPRIGSCRFRHGTMSITAT